MLKRKYERRACVVQWYSMCSLCTIHKVPSPAEKIEIRKGRKGFPGRVEGFTKLRKGNFTHNFYNFCNDPEERRD